MNNQKFTDFGNHCIRSILEKFTDKYKESVKKHDDLRMIAFTVLSFNNAKFTPKDYTPTNNKLSFNEAVERKKKEMKEGKKHKPFRTDLL